MIAKDILSNEFRVIDANETISHALSLFEEIDAIVVMEGNRYYGMLVQKELLRAKLPPNAKVRSFVRHAPKLKTDEPVEEIARLMLENDVYQLPVFEGEKLIGVVKADDILLKIAPSIGDLPIENFISKDIVSVAPNDNIGKVIKLFREKNISRLPVIDDGKLVGIITMHDLMEKVVHPEDKPEYGEFVAEKKRYLKIPVKGVMQEAPFTMPPDAKTKDVIREIINRNIGGMLIAKDDKLIGLVTKRDLLEPIARAGKEEKIFIQFCGELHKIEGFDKEEGLAILDSFKRKYKSLLENGYIYIYLKQHKERKHGLPLIYAQIRITSPKGVFVASNEGYGFHNALKNAIKAMEKHLDKIKEKEK